MQIDKSTRHTKLIGECGEAIVGNWLSRSGFEVALVDHTGIDAVAYQPSTGERLGLTVKSRTRKPGTENGPVYVFRRKARDREKVVAACRAFGCEPWLAIYVETTSRADLYLTSLQHYDRTYRHGDKAIDAWKMREADRRRYAEDRHVWHLELLIRSDHWVHASLDAAGSEGAGHSAQDD